MDDKKNIILAVLLTAAILFGWPYVSTYFFPAANPPATKIEGGKTTPVANPAADPAADSVAAIRDRAVVLKESPRIPIRTPKLDGSINLKGVRIDDIVLPTYKETIAKDSPDVRLYSPAGTQDAYFAGFGWQGEGLKTPNKDTVWTAQGSELTPTSPVTLTWNNGVGQTFEIRLSVDENYMITAAQKVSNSGAGTVGVKPYGYISRSSIPKDPDTWTIHIGPMGVFNDAANYDVNYKDLDKGPSTRDFQSKGGWIGFTDKYWLSALVPGKDADVAAQFRKGAGTQYQADVALDSTMLVPGKSVTQTLRLFVGAKEVKTLQAYERGGVKLFDRAIDWGWFYWFEQPIFALLHWLFETLGNFGVAIICLTFVVRGLMFPVAQRQFASMAAMRAVQPKMKALQEKYKDDKPRLQQEMMALYKTEKVNPLAGCLPIFIQIPIFFALYKVLMLTIEMRHQPFVLWIKDLSAPDPLHILNLFGLLPFTPPSFLGIGVLALLLGISMYFQFKLNPAQMDPMQQQIFSIMPWMMMFIMAPFAAGLLVYWITNNCLSMAQQWWLYRRHPVLSTAVAK
ncbi:MULTISPECIES: membrane protein insertase YidC [unclassified Sphingobium]|uniref:membrane protein insertase YidC n=1 Tax=unclassified Sphingobium TaxID=2611147 RepID=UPI000D16D0BE|nr:MULTISPECIES: membrane protein insertase YidC [unclassified Sphingobium]MBG6117641.1 YidC/Oxa1 family membrane protein insertase [Sphingobium sp. JAI105]PSO12722.1 membrane protein insertase YidC [Sphingobium sp. AEW4]TWD09914.1 protein translocase subunit yidC [Sphingobium sp. AEW010]TWD26585.1 protein translocase subunit yidC [Sphingobium sp. AEW013]TWD27646.1 protein translocase subunit yidC [Sphingobium sp. AEW001]